jgi:hypothetical protein
LSRIHPAFPTDTFAAALERVVAAEVGPVNGSDTEANREVAILQTIAPNLEHFRGHLIRCLQAGLRVRILLAWPYSLAACLREEVLKRYSDEPMADDFGIHGSVIANWIRHWPDDAVARQHSLDRLHPGPEPAGVKAVHRPVCARFSGPSH